MLIDAVDGAMDLIDQRCCKKWAVVSGDLLLLHRAFSQDRRMENSDWYPTRCTCGENMRQ